MVPIEDPEQSGTRNARRLLICVISVDLSLEKSHRISCDREVFINGERGSEKNSRCCGASIHEWACATYGKPLSELSARETAGAIAHVNKLILQKRKLMEARSDWDASGAI